MSDAIQCPFCGEVGFDLVGLKTHLAVDCDAFERTDLANTFRFESAADRVRAGKPPKAGE